MVRGLQIFRINLAIKFDSFKNTVKVVAKDASGVGLKHDSFVTKFKDTDNSLVFII